VIRPKAVAAHTPALIAETPQAAAPTPAAGGAVSMEGKWQITVKGPTGPQVTELVVERVNGQLTGTQTGGGVSSPILDAVFEGNNLRWANQVTKPIKLTVKFDGVIEGNTIKGKCKAGMMGSYPFSGMKL
jgi:hypothetical protein